MASPRVARREPAGRHALAVARLAVEAVHRRAPEALLEAPQVELLVAPQVELLVALGVVRLERGQRSIRR